MIPRDQLLRYGALLLILVFVGETIFLGLSNFNSAAPSDVPTPTPVSFSGSSQVRGTVLQLGYGALAMCDSGTKLDEELRSAAGVRSALFASPQVLAVQFEQNASIDAVAARVAQACGTPLFRSATVDLLPAQLTLNTSSGSQDLSTRQLEAYFSNQGFPGFQAFVSPSLKVGDDVTVAVDVVVQDNQFVSVTAQQPDVGLGVPAVPTPATDGNASTGNASAAANVSQ